VLVHERGHLLVDDRGVGGLHIRHHRGSARVPGVVAGLGEVNLIAGPSGMGALRQLSEGEL
jgi:hypothetical protein